MEHFPIACIRSKRVKEVIITNNDGQINISVLIRMWGHFNSKKVILDSNLENTYQEIAEPLFKEFAKHKYSQIICSIASEPNDEKGITIIKNNKQYISLETANKFSFPDLTKDMCKQAKRILVIELFVCSH